MASALVAVLLGSVVAAAQDAEPRRAPNFVCIMADDLGYGDVGCFGSRRIDTPHLDTLAAGGLRMTDFHSSGAVCSPTRAGLMTGRYQQRCGIPMVISAKNHRHVGLPVEEVTIAERLRDAGYATGIVGKWHLGYQVQFNPLRQGFDRFRGYVSGNVDYFSHIDQTGVADWWDGERRIVEEGYTTHLITQHAVRFIEAHADRPFFLYVAHEAPHYPYQGPNDKAERTDGGRFRTQGARGDVEAAYREMVEAMDDGVGRIVAALRQADLEGDTLVWFFSDNGANPRGSNGPWRGHKGSLWEGGHRVPCIARWPGRIRPGSRSDQLAITLDVFPTLLALAGASPSTDRPNDGSDLAPLMLDGKSLGERTLFWGHGAQRAMRRGSWKLLIDGKKRSGAMLFDLAADPAEVRDLSAGQPDRVAQMRAELQRWETDVNPDGM